MSWTDERVELLKKMWGEGQSASQIAKELGGVTRNAVIGKVHRLGLSNRAGPTPTPATPAATGAAAKPEAKAKPAPKPAEAKARPAAKPAPRPVEDDVAEVDEDEDNDTRPAALGQRDQPRGAGQGIRDREEGAPPDADGTDRADLQMARG
jgi:GcrA cell cycle regulator